MKIIIDKIIMENYVGDYYGRMINSIIKCTW